MPDIGLFEIALIGILAIILVKPDDWPSLLRKVGYYYGTVHRYLLSAKTQSRQLYEDITRLADPTAIDGTADSELSEGEEPEKDPPDEPPQTMSYDRRTVWRKRFERDKGRHRL